MLYQLGDIRPLLKGDNYVAPNAAVIANVLMERNSSAWFGALARRGILRDLATTGTGGCIRSAGWSR